MRLIERLMMYTVSRHWTKVLKTTDKMSLKQGLIHEQYTNISLYTVCPRKNGYEGISGHIKECVRHIHNFIFDLVCPLPWAVCLRKSLKSV